MATPQPRSLEFNARALPVSIVIFTAFFFLSGFRGWLFLLIGSGGLWILAYVWARSLRAGLRVERHVRSLSTTVGQRVEERLRLVNHSRFPAVWVEIVDHSTNLADPIKLVMDVEGRSARTRWPTHRFARRGIYSLGPTGLRTGDPFGIYTVEKEDPAAGSMIVLAPTVELARAGKAPAGWAGAEDGGHGPSARHVSQGGVQPYVAGDSLRRIHWPATAHRGQLVVRRFESVAAQDWWIVVDLDKTAHHGIGLDSTLELAVVVAASLASQGMHQGRKVGLVMSGSRPTVIPLGSGPRHQWRLQVALAGAGPGDQTLQDLLRSKVVDGPAQAMRILVTASVRPDWMARIRPGDRGGGTVVYFLDSAGFGGKAATGALQSLRNRNVACVSIGRQTLQAAYPELGSGGRPGRLADRVIPMEAGGGQPSWPPMN